MENIKVEGFCGKGYEKVQTLFEKNFREGEEENAQLCVFVGGEKVVDLFGTAVGDAKYGPETLTNMFSSGKSIAAIVVAMMVDRELLSYDNKIVDYWPEFGKNGKNELTLADVLRHESGLQDFNHTLKWTDFGRESIKDNVMGEIIENLEPFFPTKQLGVSNPDGTETRRAYHALTRGWILNEIVRRVDPQKRTIGEILENEVCINGIHCGISEGQIENTTTLRVKPFSWLIRQCFTPKAFGGATNMTLLGMGKMMATMSKKSEYSKLMDKNKPALEGVSEKVNFVNLAGVFDQAEVKKGEIPSANCHGSARGMAELAAIMANKGKRLANNAGSMSDLMSEDTWNKMHSSEKFAKDAAFPGGLRTNFTQGGICVFKPDSYPKPIQEGEMKLNSCRDGFYGWMGLGGSILQWHPELNIGFGYAHNNLQWWEMNEMGGRMQQAVLECVKELK